jgi:hypothetical protein
MSQRFEQLRERLLRAGIAPRHVRRYIGELRDHYDDLVEEDVNRGVPRHAAEAEAHVRLGTDETLAAAILQRPELRSLTARFPWAVFGVGPVLLLTVCVVAATLIEGGFLELHLDLVRTPANPHPVKPDWLKPALIAWNWLATYATPLAIAALLAVIGQRQRVGAGWIVTGVLIVCVVGANQELVIHWHEPGPNELSLGYTLSYWGALRAAANLLLAGAFYWLWQQRNASPFSAGLRE